MGEEKKEPKERRPGKKVLICSLIALFVLAVLLCVFFVTPLKEMVLAKKVAPEVTLELLRGPELDAESGKYLFEVEAKATGQPEPEITFNRYDDPEQVGENRITLLLKGGESFTLVVLAENSAGKVTDELKLETEDTGDGSDKPGPGSGPGPVSPPAAENRPPVISKIVLSKDLLQTGGTYTVTAEVSDPDGDTLTYQWSVTGGTVTNLNANPITWKTPAALGDPQLSVVVRDGKGGEAVLSKQVPVGYLRLSPVEAQSGQIIKDQEVKAPACVYVGDSDTNRIVRGFVNFNIGSLEGITIKTVELRLAEPKVWGDPTFMHGTSGTTGLRVNVALWKDRGSEPLALEHFSLPGDTVEGYTAYDITHTSPAGEGPKKLVDLLQNCINSGYNRFLIRLLFSKEDSDLDNRWDGVEYQLNTISLYLTF